jgi:hypothetical protein
VALLWLSGLRKLTVCRPRRWFDSTRWDCEAPTSLTQEEAMAWWMTNPQLLRIEMNLAHAATGGRVVRSGDTIYYEEQISADGVRFAYRMRYADDHPHSAPRVYLLHPELPHIAEIHRFSDGALCLFGAEEWHPTFTGLWVRNRVAAWVGALIQYSRTGVWPSMRR